MAHRLNPIVQANNTAVGRNLALSTLDMVVSKVILLRMGELSGMTKTQRDPSPLRAHLSADVFVHAINIVASSLNDTTSSMNNVEYATLTRDARAIMPLLGTCSVSKRLIKLPLHYSMQLLCIKIPSLALA